ncbi:hypothetical protein CB1_001660001 [Camelus ferus]|nr:hypothetical protein CB1_001660001 [Camelus ferus]
MGEEPEERAVAHCTEAASGDWRAVLLSDFPLVEANWKSKEAANGEITIVIECMYTGGKVKPVQKYGSEPSGLSSSLTKVETAVAARRRPTLLGLLLQSLGPPPYPPVE